MFFVSFPDFRKRVEGAYQGNGETKEGNPAKAALSVEIGQIIGNDHSFTSIYEEARETALKSAEFSGEAIELPRSDQLGYFENNLSQGRGDKTKAAVLHYYLLCDPKFAKRAERMNEITGFNPEKFRKRDVGDDNSDEATQRETSQLPDVQTSPIAAFEALPSLVAGPEGSELAELFLVACDAGKTDVVQALLDKGLSVNSGRTSDGYSGLMGASHMGHVDTATLLLDRGADPNFKSNDDGWTALMAAAHGNSSAVAKLLLDRGADIDQRRPNSGETALFMAIRNHSADMARLLLERGAETNLTLFHDNEWTVSKEAARAGNAEILDLISDFTQRK